MSVTFTIPGDPQSLKRHRSRNMGTFIQQYDPASNKVAKDVVQRAWQHAGHTTFEQYTPLAVTLYCKFKRPQAHFGTGKNAQTLKATAARWHVARPDGDNLLKLIGDSLNGFAWHDDSQVARWSVEKRYCQEDELPHTEVHVMPLKEQRGG